ncbi:MAG: C69 family dipeptidase [Flavobacteriales bacterium]|nr:C69 family dipeptidase [Flavobacteriales bacterium]
MRKILFTIALLTGSYFSILACTNILVTKGASKDGSTMLTYSADSYQMYGELYHYPRASYAKGSMRKVYEWDVPGHLLGEIPQAEQTYNVIGNMNEYQLCITETTFGGRAELEAPENGILDYGSLIYIALQRCKTAREAIKLMTDLVSQYGYASSGESFSLADKNEVWIMELIGKGKTEKGAVWVARRVPDGYICAHANQARITTFPLNDPENCLYAPDVISFAKKMGYYSGNDKNFDFSGTYAPLNFIEVRACEARVWSIFRRIDSKMDKKYEKYALGFDLTAERMPLWIKPKEKLGVKDVMELMRDHYEDTPLDTRGTIMAGAYDSPYGLRPLEWDVDGKKYFCERPVSTPQTGFSIVSQSRSWLPDEIGGVLWFGVDDTYFTCYTPVYTSSTRVAPSIAVGNGDFNTYSPTAAFWKFNRVSQNAYAKYNLLAPEIRKKQSELEAKHIRTLAAIDAAAAVLYKESPDEAVEFVTNFSINNAEEMVAQWDKLEAFLLLKYFDGVIHPEKDGKFIRSEYGGPGKVETPGWDIRWRKEIIKQDPSRFACPE